jgi:hypothetical protein
MRNRSVNKKKQKKSGGSLRLRLGVKHESKKNKFTLKEIIGNLGKVLLLSELIHGMEYYCVDTDLDDNKFYLGKYDSEMKSLVAGDTTSRHIIRLDTIYSKDNYKLIFSVLPKKNSLEKSQNFQNKHGIPLQHTLTPGSVQDVTVTIVNKPTKDKYDKLPKTLLISDLYECLGFSERLESYRTSSHIIDEGNNLLQRFHNEKIPIIDNIKNIIHTTNLIKYSKTEPEKYIRDLFEYKLKNSIQKYYRCMFFINI